MPRGKERGKVYSMSLPRALNEMVLEKMKTMGYQSVGEVCRELLRNWVNE